jgi:hypothetical protein
VAGVVVLCRSATDPYSRRMNTSEQRLQKCMNEAMAGTFSGTIYVEFNCGLQIVCDFSSLTFLHVLFSLQSFWLGLSLSLQNSYDAEIHCCLPDVEILFTL